MALTWRWSGQNKKQHTQNVRKSMQICMMSAAKKAPGLCFSGVGRLHLSDADTNTDPSAIAIGSQLAPCPLPLLIIIVSPKKLPAKKINALKKEL